MKNYNYSATTYFEDSEVTVKTNDAKDAAKAFLEAIALDLPCDIVSNITGEVLVLHSEEEDHCVREMMPVMMAVAVEMLLADED